MPYVATIAPVRMIVAEIAPEGVAEIVPPGASPHAFELRPSHARQVEGAQILFFAAKNLDGWATQLPARHRVEMMTLIPGSEELLEDDHAHHGHDGHGVNPHFWSDPVLVSTMIPRVLDAMLRSDTTRRQELEARAAQFVELLQALDQELKELLAPVSGRAVIVMHPSWDYFCRRYEIRVAGALEPAPGHEPSPRELEELAAAARKHDVRAVLTEPQLPRAPAVVLAEMLGVGLHEIDPLGGVAGRDRYAELLRYNAAVLRKALQ